MSDYFLKPNENLAKPKRNKGVNFLIILLFIFSFIGGTIFGLANSQTIGLYLISKQGGRLINQEEAYKYKNVDFNQLFSVWQAIKEKYLNKDQVTDSQLFYGALAGSVASLGDPYSIFLNPKQAQEFEQELAGSFDGIGIEVGIKKNVLTVISALPDSPAKEAGILPNDQILEIDGYETAYLTIDQAINLIRGQRGTQVALTIHRESVSELIKVDLTRAKISVDSVKWRMIDQQIALLEISSFNQDTSTKFKKAINEILMSNPQGLILDLRYNPGGYFDTAIEVASGWVESGTIVTEAYNDPSKNIDYQALGNAKLKDLKTVVLINGGSASSAEIVAGALKDYQLATLIGETTFGKGTIQDLTNFNDGSALKLTIAHWLTPKGTLIEGNGIVPDIEVELTREDYDNGRDPQLDKAIEIINK